MSQFKVFAVANMKSGALVGKRYNDFLRKQVQVEEDTTTRYPVVENENLSWLTIFQNDKQDVLVDTQLVVHKNGFHLNESNKVNYHKRVDFRGWYLETAMQRMDYATPLVLDACIQTDFLGKYHFVERSNFDPYATTYLLADELFSDMRKLSVPNYAKFMLAQAGKLLSDLTEAEYSRLMLALEGRYAAYCEEKGYTFMSDAFKSMAYIASHSDMSNVDVTVNSHKPAIKDLGVVDLGVDSHGYITGTATGPSGSLPIRIAYSAKWHQESLKKLLDL